MASSTKWRLNISAPVLANYGVGLGDIELRTAAGVPRPFVLQGFTATATPTGAANLLGPAALPLLHNGQTYDALIEVPFAWPVTFGGQTYTSCWVSPYGYIAFGNAYAGDYFDGNTPYGSPSIQLSAHYYGSLKKIYAGSENGGTTFRIRIEGDGNYDVFPADPGGTVWELTFTQAAPNTVRLDLGPNNFTEPYARPPATGIGDGIHQDYRATFPDGVVNVGYDVTTVPVEAEGVASASAEENGTFTFYRAQRAADGDSAQSWYTGGTGNSGWWQFAFNSPVEIVEYVLTAPDGNDINTNPMPKDWTFEYWDGAAWQVADTQTGQPAWGYSEARVFSMVAPSNNGSIALKQLTVSGLLSVPIDAYLGDLLLAPLTLSGSASAGRDGAVELPRLSLAGAGFAGEVGALTPITSPFDGLALHVAGTGVAGAAADASIMLAPITLSGSGDPPATLPGLSVDGRMEAVNEGVGNIELSPFDLSGWIDSPVALERFSLLATGFAGQLLRGDHPTGNLALPIMDANGAGMAGATITGNIALPLPALVATTDAPVALEPFALSGALLAGSTAAGSVMLPPLDAQGDWRPAGDVQLTVPTLDGAMVSGTVAAGRILLEPLSVTAAEREGDLALPLLSLSGQMLPGAVASGMNQLAWLALDGTMTSDAVIDGNAALPNFALDAAADTGQTAAGDASLARFGLAATGVAGIHADGAAALAALSVSGAAFADNRMDGTIALSALTASGSARADSVITGSVELSAPALSATGAAGTVITADVTLELFTLDADGHHSAVGEATVSLPLMELDALATGETVTSPTVKSVVLNTHTHAVSHYIGIAANSWAAFNGLFLAATDDGIIALAGNTDRGQRIDSVVAGPVDDFGSEQVKRVLGAYVGYRADGDMEVTVIADDHHEYTYALRPNRIANQHAARVKFGRGNAGRYWQWRLANRDGADFALDGVTLDALPLARKA